MTHNTSAFLGAAQDGGRAKYFHGRDAVWDEFYDILKDAHRERGGTVFLVQGPPGAGKTAILHEFANRAESTGHWGHARIEITCMYNPRRMAAALGDSAYVDRTVLSTGRTTKVGVSQGVAFTHDKHAEEAAERAGPSSDEVLRSHASRSTKGLLLTLDEVQNLSAHKANLGRRTAIMGVLDIIRNATAGGPVVLLAGGLGNSADVLGGFGISRLFAGCLHNIGILKAAAERNVIRDWIVKGGKVGSNVRPHILKHWIDTIASETDGWPQHIHSVAPQVARWLKRHGSLMPDTVPEAVMERGKARKHAYYAQRTSSLEEHHLCALATLIVSGPLDAATFTHMALHRALRAATKKHDPDNEMMSPVQAIQVAIKKGVIAAIAPRRLSVPIPSMHDWLLDTYGSTEGL